MKTIFPKSPLALAAVAALGSLALGGAPDAANAAKTAGTYVAGDFHNHSTCSDGATSLQKKVKKSMDRDATTPWGLDWFVQAGHGGTGNRNCTLAEDASLATPAYPLVTNANGQVLGPNTTWLNSQPPVTPAGDVSGSGNNRNMWRWNAIQSYQYPLMEYLAAYRNEPLFIGIESVVAGHEHTSMSVITGQMPTAIYNTPLPTTPGYTPLGNANALAKWAYCFDRGNSDTSRGGANAWECSVPGSLNSGNPDWNAGAAKLNGANGNNGHLKTVEAVKWMAAFHGEGSYYVPAHLERAGPFNPSGNNGFNVEHLRNFNNAGPRVAFGFESQPGHGASEQRGEYTLRRNTIGGVNVDSVGGTTFGGTGVYAAQVGGVWDALLGEGRNWWFFASSDWHSRGSFSVDDRRTDNDFWPGEYQRNYTMVRTGGSRMTPQMIVDGLRSGNTYVSSGQLIDRLAFVACASYAGPARRTDAQVEALAVTAALNKTDIDVAGCATMGEKLKVRPGAEIVVSIVVRDPSGKNFSPYAFPNPSLLQVGINQPLDAPVLHHVDVIRGLVTGFRTPGSADYAGTWPDNWVDLANPQQLRPLTTVPAAAKNTTASVLRTFNDATWTTVPGNAEFKKMTFRIPAVSASQYLRLRGTNLPPAVPYETDASGNPLSDVWTNSQAIRAKTGSTTEFPVNAMLRIPCTTVGTNLPGAEVFNSTGINGCPNHLPVVNGQRMLALDVAAWADLWFYSNPIFVEVSGSTVVAGVQ
ncbi:hypothetical protein [Aquabacterium sp. J223]|uniref:hypothetical protein n=1 Tax=Aquabacterium sp. J223 TaxID=2898431 RepID=UPI0021ADE9B6|nr:hypothetical protein [Aquabacterium sp. J223]UUX94459.1 hypothetical protein LRS07_14195 [Aquabacterium sp. J223]